MPRDGVEKFALIGMVTFPALIEESGLLPEHFADRRVARAVAALPNCRIRGVKGEINFAELCRLVEEDYQGFQRFIGAFVSDIDQARGFIFLNYTPRYTSYEYAIKYALVCILIGLMAEFFTRQHASASWNKPKSEPCCGSTPSSGGGSQKWYGGMLITIGNMPFSR